MRMLSLLLTFLLGAWQTYPSPGPGRQAQSLACTAPSMTYRWVPASGCSTSSACAKDRVAGNNASQTSSGALPTYSEAGGPDRTPDLTFNGSTDYLTFGTAIPSAVTTFTIYAVIAMIGA